jgi:FkbM family methyltransferase
MVRFFRRILHRIGLDIVQYTASTHPLARRAQLLRHHRINIVLDVGANSGQYGLQLREMGYYDKIISFEPVSSVYEQLVVNAKNDSKWETIKFALGNKDDTATINIANNTYSSSLLAMMPVHLASAPESQYVAKEKIEIRRLDSLFVNRFSTGDNLFLKIDTQGYDKAVLEGSIGLLEYIKLIQVEMSLVQLYRDEPLLDEILAYMAELGYKLVSVESGFTDEASGQLLQLDGIFLHCAE